MRKTLKVKTDKLFTNITKQISNFIEEWNKTGIVNIYSKHSTGCIWLTENEILHHADVRFFLINMLIKKTEVIKNIKYLHDLISLRQDEKK